LRIRIITAGRRPPAWVSEGYRSYARRLPAALQPELVEIHVARDAGGAAVAMRREGRRMRAAIPAGAEVIALDPAGRAMDTAGLTTSLRDWMQQDACVALLIGGPDGLEADCLQRAQRRWSLSSLTLPHRLVRILLVEQLYRAWSSLQGHPYHRA